MNNNKTSYIIKVFFILFITLLGNNYKGFSQFTASDIIAKDAIVKLKEGTLIIGIPSIQRQLDELYRLSASDNLSDKKHKLVSKRIKKYERQQALYKKYLVEGFGEHYFFSDYVFCYDYELRKADTTQTVVLIDSTTLLLNETHFIAIEGRDPEKHREKEGLVIRDYKFRLLGKPFPDFIAYSVRKSFLDSVKDIFRVEPLTEEGLKNYAITLDHRFNYFYERREKMKWTLWHFINSIF